MSYDYPTKKYPTSGDVDALATLLAQRQSDSGTTNGGIVASGGSSAVPQLGVDAAGLGLSYFKAQADAIMCAVGYQAYSDAAALGSASTTSTTFVDVGNGTSTGFSSFTFTVSVAKTYLIHSACTVFKSASSGSTLMSFQLVVDGSAPSGSSPSTAAQFFGSEGSKYFYFVVPVALSAGSHTIKLQWKVSSGMTANVAGGEEGRTFWVTG